MTYLTPTEKARRNLAWPVKGRPDLVEVFLFGRKVPISRSYRAKVIWLADCSSSQYEEAKAKRERGELSPLDEEYWARP